MNFRRNVIVGALVADAAAMGLHWLYDQSRLADLAVAGPLSFRTPDRAAYAGVRGYFAHAGKAAGAPSHYGEVLQFMLAHLAQRSGVFERVAYQQAYRVYFGPGGAYVGYVDRPMRLTIAGLLQIDQPADYPARSGADDDQIPALCAVPALVAAGAADHVIGEAVAVTNANPVAEAGARALSTSLAAIRDGAPLGDALMKGAVVSGDHLRPLLEQALSLPALDAVAAAAHFGMPCHLSQALPVAFHIAATARDLAQGAEANVLAGGDSCGRAMALGSLLGAAHGVPETLVARLANRSLIERDLERLSF